MQTVVILRKDGYTIFHGDAAACFDAWNSSNDDCNVDASAWYDANGRSINAYANPKSFTNSGDPK